MTTEAVQPRITDDRRDFVELSDDVSASPLWNHDLAPSTNAKQTL